MGKITRKTHKKKPLREKMKKMSIEGSPDYSRDLRQGISSHPPKDRDFRNTAKINMTGNCIIRSPKLPYIAWKETVAKNSGAQILHNTRADRFLPSTNRRGGYFKLTLVKSGRYLRAGPRK